MGDSKNLSGKVRLHGSLEVEKLANRLVEKSRIRDGLGEEKYKKYEALAQKGKFDEIPEFNMHKDYCNPTGRLGYYYAENLLCPRNFFRTIYDSSYMFFEGNK